MMPCRVCYSPGVTSRPVPIELYEGDTPVRRIPQAPFHTCQRCGASWYAEGADAGPSVPLPTPAAPVYDASDD